MNTEPLKQPEQLLKADRQLREAAQAHFGQPSPVSDELVRRIVQAQLQQDRAAKWATRHRQFRIQNFKFRREPRLSWAVVAVAAAIAALFLVVKPGADESLTQQAFTPALAPKGSSPLRTPPLQSTPVDADLKSASSESGILNPLQREISCVPEISSEQRSSANLLQRSPLASEKRSSKRGESGEKARHSTPPPPSGGGREGAPDVILPSTELMAALAGDAAGDASERPSHLSDLLTAHSLSANKDRMRRYTQSIENEMFN